MVSEMDLLLAFHAALTWALVGLIWVIQLVHYPLFAGVGRSEFRAYHAAHTRRITWIAGPLMLAEVGSAALLLATGLTHFWFLVSLVALAIVWASTWLQQIPQHRRLARGFDGEAHRRLVRTNAVRATAWTVRGLCLVPLLV